MGHKSARANIMQIMNEQGLCPIIALFLQENASMVTVFFPLRESLDTRENLEAFVFSCLMSFF